MTTSNSENRSTPRTRRAEAGNRPGLALTDRDIAIVLAVHDYRVLTSEQITQLFFGHAKDGLRIAQRRLQRLYHHRYLLRRPQPIRVGHGAQAMLYLLDKPGAALLSEYVPDFEQDWNPKDNKIKWNYLLHAVACNDVRVAVKRAANAAGWHVADWRDDRTMKRSHKDEQVSIQLASGKRAGRALIPDAYFVLVSTTQAFRFFLEVDRGTETVVSESDRSNTDFASKIKRYLSFYASGRYQARYGSRDMRVLTVTTSERRLANLRAATEEVGGKGRFWFTTLDQCNEGILDRPIWQIAGMKGLYALRQTSVGSREQQHTSPTR